VSSNRTLLQENDTLLSDVSHEPIRMSDLERIQLDRLNRDYEPILELWRLLLESSTLNLRTGRIAQFAFVFDMHRLFEEFVAEFLRRHKNRIRLEDGCGLAKVEYQRRLGRFFGEFHMNADLMLTDDTGHSFLLDTKYKVLDLHHDIFPAKYTLLGVEPRGFEPLTSAVQRRHHTFPELSGACKIAANTRIF
jgi:5-methylcytosine-specific restriction enzyme subunit McrC